VPAFVAFIGLVVLLVASAVFSLLVNGDAGGGVLGATATPGVAVGPVSASPSPVVTLPPTPSPSPSPSPTATPAATRTTPRPTPIATARPTPRATPRPATAPAVPASSPAGAVRAFYDAVERHDFEQAAALWTAEMRQRYPPSRYIDGRFAGTTRIDLPRLSTVARSGDTARVAVTVIEYRTDEPTPRRYEGAWDLVRRDGRWLLADPDLAQTA
jgi:hypothetical protein